MTKVTNKSVRELLETRKGQDQDRAVVLLNEVKESVERVLADLETGHVSGALPQVAKTLVDAEVCLTSVKSLQLSLECLEAVEEN